MHRAAALLLLVAIAGAVVSGCGDTPKPVTAAGLDGRAFASTSVTGRELVDGTELTLEFDGARLAANAGCNTIAGTYAVERGLLTQGEQVRTQMSCGAARDEQEQWFAKLLADGARATLLEHTLTLEGGGVKVVFRSAKPTGTGSAGGTRSVVGPLWTLVEAEGRGGAQVALAAAKPPTLQLSDDGRAAIFAGCNRGGGPATFADGFVTFGAIATTRMACDPPADTLERFVLSVLDGKAAAGFDGEGRLSLAKDGDRLLFEAR